MGLFGQGARRASRASATGQHIRIVNPWHAVEVRTARGACPACAALAGRRFLSSEAPALPVAGCLEPAACRAVYRHHDDRRAGPRRAADLPGLARTGSGREGSAERRTGRGRRGTDVAR